MLLIVVVLVVAFVPKVAPAQSIGCDVEFDAMFPGLDEVIDVFGSIPDATSVSKGELVDWVRSNPTYAARLVSSLVVVQAGRSTAREALQELSALDSGATIDMLKELGAKAPVLTVISTLKVISTLDIEEILTRLYDRAVEQAFMNRFNVTEEEVVAVFCVIEFSVEGFPAPVVASPN